LHQYFGDSISGVFGKLLKRESGENPEQARYCKLFYGLSVNILNIPFATVCHPTDGKAFKEQE
jgi:hypothetical protein